jgi:protein SCO1/2
MRKIHLIGFGLFFTALGLMLGIYKFQKPSSYSMDIRQDHDPNVLGGDFSLTDQHGKRRSIHEFKGKYMLIYFGYTYCPDICPMGLTNITKALKLLERNRDDVIPIFITVDPTRDTPENLQLYAQNFHPNYVMLTGTEAEIETCLLYTSPSPRDH